jgi:four helix bundle protein
MIRKHRELPVWVASIELVEATYTLTSMFPRDEQFGLTSQMRRAAVSVPANIAEGAARKSTPELIQFLHIASGSLAELDTHLEIARRIGYLDNQGESLQPRIDNVHAQLLAVIAPLRQRQR